MRIYIIILAVVSLNSASCIKDPMFDGKNSIEGTVLFQDQVTHESDTAVGAIVRIVQVDDTAIFYETTANSKGRYAIRYLRNGEYDIHISFKQHRLPPNEELHYTWQGQITVRRDEYEQMSPILAWSNNTTVLRIHVSDTTAAANPVSNARVYLYPNAYFMIADTSSGIGSIRSGSTDGNGQVLFSGLDQQVYYYRVRYDIGQYSFDNMGSDTATALLPTNQITEENTVIQ